MNILIVDDLEQDRKMLRRTIHKNHPEYKISEASNLSHMYAELNKPCELLFLDISLNGDNIPDDEGLNAIYNIMDGYPGLPVCVVTGYFKDKIHKFLGDFLTETTQIVNCLDKGVYKSKDLLEVFSKAEKYRSNFRKSRDEMRVAEDLAQEYAEMKEKRIEKKFSIYIQKLEKKAKKSELHRMAFEGSCWESRIEAEKNITGDTCQGNSLYLCVKMDKLSKFLCGNEGQECTYRQKQECPFLQGRKCSFRLRAEKLSENYCLSNNTKKMLNDAWDIRNSIVHGTKIASCQDALNLLNVVELMQRLKQKQ
jgi:DNA-binding LytR/AlgR family response regulator